MVYEEDAMFILPNGACWTSISTKRFFTLEAYYWCDDILLLFLDDLNSRSGWIERFIVRSGASKFAVAAPSALLMVYNEDLFQYLHHHNAGSSRAMNVSLAHFNVLQS
jgi:hypothetical protein